MDILKRTIIVQSATGDINLEDPDPNMSAEEIRQFWLPTYPQLAQSEIEETLGDSGPVITFVRKVGTKGNSMLSLDDIDAGTGFENLRVMPVSDSNAHSGASDLMRYGRGDFVTIPTEALGMV